MGRRRRVDKGSAPDGMIPKAQRPVTEKWTIAIACRQQYGSCLDAAVAHCLVFNTVATP
jgi:hypothetical protein